MPAKVAKSLRVRFVRFCKKWQYTIILVSVLACWFAVLGCVLVLIFAMTTSA